jgi:hypothetical protein
MKLYAQVDVFAAEDRWYFDVPLTLRLRKPLRSRCRPMANKCKNLGKQVQTTYHDWTDDVEPVLPTPPVHEDSYGWNP